MQTSERHGQGAVWFDEQQNRTKKVNWIYILHNLTVRSQIKANCKRRNEMKKNKRKNCRHTKNTTDTIRDTWKTCADIKTLQNPKAGRSCTKRFFSLLIHVGTNVFLQTFRRELEEKDEKKKKTVSIRHQIAATSRSPKTIALFELHSNKETKQKRRKQRIESVNRLSARRFN